MITNFDEYYTALSDSDWEFTVDNLSIAELTILKTLVAMWDTEELSPAIDMLSDYYGIKVPNSVLIEIFQKDLDLAMENATGGIRDTCQREILADAVLKKAGYRSWPTYGEGEKAYDTFIDGLNSALEKLGGEFVQ